MKKFLIFSLVLMFSFFAFLVDIKGAKNYTVVDGGYYGVNESIEDIDLNYGLSSLNYKHEDAYSAVTSQNRIVGYECGGATYSANALVLGKEYSQSAHILTIGKDSNLEIVTWAIIKDGKWTLSTILEVAKDYEEKHKGYKVIAGINADFFDINADDDYPYTVLGTMVADGDVYKTSSLGWAAVNFKNDGSNTPLVKVDNPVHNSLPTLAIYNENDEIIKTFNINKVNEEPINDEISVFYGLYKKVDKNHNCNYTDVTSSFILDSEGNVTVAKDNTSFFGKGIIQKFGSATLKENDFALKTTNEEILSYLKTGVKVRVQNELTGEMEGAKNVVGSVSTFLKNSVHIERDHYEYMQYRYPRTLAGYTKDGDIVLAVTDGRQASKGYFGLNGVESAAQMLHYGCVEACSFDGGGSTTMVILKDGKLTCVNSPSDGHLRRDGNAILVVSRVPELEIDYKAKPNEIEIEVKRLEEMSGYDEYFVKIDNRLVALVDDKAKFTNLTSNTEYEYALYVKKGSSTVLMPYSGVCVTQKIKYEIESITLNKEENDFKLNLSLNDNDKSVITYAYILGGKRINLKKGEFIVPFEYIDNVVLNDDAYLFIIYQLSEKDERIEVKVDLSNLSFESASVALDSVLSSIDAVFSSFLD